MAAPSPRSDASLWAVILAGGIGSRFWPASTPARPKQILPLAGGEPLVAGTVRRARLLCAPGRVRVLAGDHLVEPIRDALAPQAPPEFMVEPRPRGTAPALAWAAREIAARDPDAVMVSLHADHVIEPDEAFRDVLLRAAAVARESGLLVTVAVEPDRPETGYGYIRPGEPLSGDDGGGDGAFRVDAFVEKPDAATARRYVDAGHLWNSGIFVWSASAFLARVRECAPEVGRHLSLLDDGDVDGFFDAVPSCTVDRAVLERSGDVAAVRATFAWDDVGNWDALGRVREGDGRGNVAVGEARVVDGGENVVWSEEGPVVLFGVEGMVVVRAHGVTFVTPRSRAPSLKALLDALPDDLRTPGGDDDGAAAP